MTDIFAYPGEANPNDVKASDPTVLRGGGRLKYWNGSAWVLKTLKYWNGASWATKTLKYWNGAAWVW